MTSDPADLTRNNLDRAASPYLLQHKDNPVHWQMWSPTALAAATREDRPILLSIGYAACHWCHVMAHESFEDASTADVMNELFVNIKVDREERPDIDQIYMGALHRLGEPGGWPLTMFLTPKGEPFWGGTYFPKEPRFGRPAFTEILRAVAGTYRARRTEVESNARALSDAIAERLPAGSSADMTPAASRELAERLTNAMDRENGGLPGAPKFPNAPLLEFLWRAGEKPADRPLREPVLLTLRRIVAGGIHDHLGGGFARYTVDERWLVPHFEKMLYDNAQLLELLALAHLATGEPEFRQAAEDLVGWLEREMLVGDAFSASLDADSEGEEGKFYVWTREEIDAVLGLEDAALFSRFYDAAPPGNWTDDHSGLTRIILNRLNMPAPTPDEAARLAMLRGKLLESRDLRVRPGRDDKVLADWNGMMIAALAAAGAALGEPAWIDLAAKAFHFISTAMAKREAGDLRLAHSYRDGRLVWPGMASDYVMMIRAAISLAEAQRPETSAYLDLARGWSEALRRHHLTDTGLLTTAADDSTDVILRLAPTTDDAVPNPNGIYAAALLRLAALSGEDRFRLDAEAILAALAGSATGNPFGHASAWNALDARLHMAEILIAGPKPGRGQLRAAAQKLPFLHRTIRELDDGESLAADHPAAAFRHRAGESAAALICYGERCSLPVHDPAEIEATFAAMRG